MYEEEEDDFPRSFRLLSHNLQQPEMNGNLSGRAEVFLSTRVEVSRMMQQNQDDWARQNKINKEFADAFPNHNKYAQRAPSVSTDQMYGSGSGSGSGSYLDFNAPMQYSPSTQPNFAPVNYTQPAGQNSRGQSFSAMTPTEQQPATPASQELTPAAQEPSSAPQLAPYFSYEGTAAPGQSGMLYNQATSAFTSELSNDARMLMGAQMSWDGSAQPTFDNAMDFQSTSYFQMPTAGNEQDLPSDYPDLTSQPQDSAEEPNWSNFIDDNEWMEPYDADAYNQGQNANQD